MRIAMLGLKAVGRTSGGIERAVEEISTRLALRGHEVTVFCRTRRNSETAREYKGVRLLNLPAIYTKHLEAFSHTLVGTLRAGREWDIVHIHGIGPSTLSFIPRIRGIGTVVTIHALDWRREKWGPAAKLALRFGARTAVAFPHRTIAVSQQIIRFFPEKIRRHLQYIPNGVTQPQLRPIRQLQRFGVSGNDYVLYLGRLVPEKGCHTLIDAFRRVAGGMKLLIVGETSHSGDYVQLLRAKAGGDVRIVFAGALYGEERDEAFSNAACFVLPSTLEGMPIVLLEAMSYGCPALCSDIPENLEVLSPSQQAAPTHAAVFAADNSADLGEKLNALLTSRADAVVRAERARSYVLSAYNWDTVTGQTEAVYEQVVGSRGRAS